jgi:thioredoxin 1
MEAQLVASEAVLNLTDDTFETEVLNATEPVLVDFWAEWCQPCKMLSPTMDEIADEYEGRAKITKMNIDDNQQVATKFGIMSIPTVLLFKGGEVQNTFVGLSGKEKFTGALDELL